MTYKSRKPGNKVSLSGVVLRHKCEETSNKKCVLAGEPFEGRAVQVVGGGKTYATETNSKGAWRPPRFCVAT